MLGNGEEIKAFHDPWLRGKSDYCVENSHLNEVRDVNVCNYFRLDTKEWDVHKVMQDFHEDDIQHVLATRIPQRAVTDRITWTHSSTCQYSVKTTYQFWLMQNQESTNESLSEGWKKLWKVQVPHKFRTFMWRVCNNTLPVRNVIKRKGVHTTIICPMCDRDIEHLLHQFFDCQYAKECWQKANLSYDMQEVEAASLWLLEKLSMSNTVETESITAVLWVIWFARNQKVWDHKSISPTSVMEISNKMISDWQEASKQKRLRICPPPIIKPQASTIKWNPPPSGKLKLNIDASVFDGESSFKLGLVIRDEYGLFVRGRTMHINGPVTVLEAETRGVCEALGWIEDLQLQHIMIECDSELTVRAINKGVVYYLEVGNQMEWCHLKTKR